MCLVVGRGVDPIPNIPNQPGLPLSMRQLEIGLRVGYPTTLPMITPSATMLKEEYVAHVDSKKRVVIRSASHKVYRVRTYPDGHIVFIPCEIKPSPKLKKETLAPIERSIAKRKNWKLHKAVDIKVAVKRISKRLLPYRWVFLKFRNYRIISLKGKKLANSMPNKKSFSGNG